MEPDSSSGVEHLLRATRDVRLPDGEMERRVAAKNGVVARALRESRISLDTAQHLLYDPELWDALVSERPGCVTAAAILETGCALASLEDRLLRWSPDLDRAVEQCLDLLLLLSQRLLAPEELIQTLRRRPILTAEEVELAREMVPLFSDAAPLLLPVLLRTLTAEMRDWPKGARQELQARVLAALREVDPGVSVVWNGSGPIPGEEAPGAALTSLPPLPILGEGEPSDAHGGSPFAQYWERGARGVRAASAGVLPDNDLDVAIARWRTWWDAEGRHRYLDPVDAVPEPSSAPPPLALLPPGGGEYTLDPPSPFSYWGRRDGRMEPFVLSPRGPVATPWRLRLARVLNDGEPAASEYEGVCALDGYRIHETRLGEALLLSIPDPDLPFAWLSCTECGLGGYVRYSLETEVALRAGHPRSGSGMRGR